jgi:hypothetical protein
MVLYASREYLQTARKYLYIVQVAPHEWRNLVQAQGVDRHRLNAAREGDTSRARSHRFGRPILERLGFADAS